MDPREFQKLAIELACENSPAKTRTAISRSYYAAYHTGLEAINKMGFTIDEWGGHGSLRDHLNNSSDVDIEKVSSKLSDLHRDRIDADYKFYDERKNKKIENPNTARSNAELANEIIKTLDACTNNPVRYSQITRAIQEYRNKLPVYK